MTLFRVASVAVLSLASALVAQSSPVPPQQFADLGEMKLESGAVIHGCKLGYRTLGTLNESRSNAIVFPTWFTGNTADLLRVVNSQGLVDPAGYYFILVDALGDGVSCSPSNSVTGRPPVSKNFVSRTLAMVDLPEPESPVKKMVTPCL